MALVDFFLKVEGVDGESGDAKHKGEMELSGWNWGAEQNGDWQAGGGLGAGKVKVQTFNFTKKVDKASVTLLKACASGEHFPKATLTCRKAGKEQQEYLKVELENVMITNYKATGSGTSEVLPLDDVSLAFEKINWIYKAQESAGSLGGEVKGGWNVKERVVV